MNANLSYLVLAIGFTCLAACAAPTQSKAQKAEAKFAEMDANHDGKLNYHEFSKTRVAAKVEDPKSVFQKCDTNRDGFLSKEEIVTAIRSRKG